MIYVGAVALAAALVAGGCAAPPGSGIFGHRSFRSRAALEEAVANDAFPTASQAGILSKASSENVF